MSYPEYLDWRDEVTKVSALAVFGVRQFGVRSAEEGRDATQPMWGLLISDTYFPLLGIRPAEGRVFTADECGTSGAAPVAMIGTRAASGSAAPRRRWDEKSASTTCCSQSLVWCRPTSRGRYAGLAFDLWVPIAMQPGLTGEAGTLQARDIHWLQAIGHPQAGTYLRGGSRRSRRHQQPDCGEPS